MGLSVLLPLCCVTVGSLLRLPQLQFFSPVIWERNTCFTGFLGEASEVVYNHRALCSGESKHSTVAIKEMKLLIMVSLFLFFKSCWSLFVIYLAVLGLGCSSSLSLSDERELLSSCGSWASHCSGFSCGAWAFRCGGFRSSKFGAYGLRCSAAFGVILDRGSNQCLLHWQADSLPLSHQGRLHSLYLDCRGMAFFPSGL